MYANREREDAMSRVPKPFLQHFTAHAKFTLSSIPKELNNPSNDSTLELRCAKQVRGCEGDFVYKSLFPHFASLAKFTFTVYTRLCKLYKHPEFRTFAHA